MRRQHQRIEMALALVLMSGLSIAIGTAQQTTPHHTGQDSGSGSAVARFVGAVADVSDALAVETTLAEWTAREERIIAQARAGLMDHERAASELYGLARAHWNRANRAIDPPAEKEFQYREANRLLEKSIDLAPDSYAAAKSWMLIGNTYIGNRSDPASSIEPFEQADRVLQDLTAKSDPADGTSRDALFKSRGIVTERLGYANLYTNREDEAYRYFKTLVESPEMSQNVDPGFLLNANRRLIQLAADRDEVEEAQKYYASVKQLIDSGDVDPDRAVMIRWEAIRAQWPDPFNKERIAALEAMWSDTKYRSSQQILWIGDELTWPYFFSEPMARDKFAMTSEEFLTRIRPYMKESSQSKFTILDTFYVRNLLLAVEFATISGDSEQVEKLTDEFTRAYEGRDVSIGAKLDPSKQRSRRNAERLLGIYRNAMSAHFHAAQERQRRKDARAEPAPTGAK